MVALFTLALTGYGLYSLTQLPIDAVPDITNNQVQIVTNSPALAASEVERLVTFPLEQAVNNIPGKLEIRSFSRFGLSLVTIVFTEETDIYWARQQVLERLAQVEIPNGVGKPYLSPVTTGLGEIYQYVVRPKPGFEKAFSSADLRSIQDWQIRPMLLGVEGIADVSALGGNLKQYEVVLNSERLNSAGVNILDVLGALERNNQNSGGSYLEKGPSLLLVRTEGLINTEDDIRAIVVKQNPGGMPLTIADIGEVQEGSATRYGATTYNDHGEVCAAIVMMLKGENSSKVIERVKKRIVEIEKALPPGIMIEPFLDRTKMVNNAIGTVETNLLEGALIVIFVLVVFLGNLRAGLIVASVIPLSMLFAVILMNLFGVSGNLMSLGALDFGMLVDGAVIIVEAIMHHLRLRNSAAMLTQAEMDKEVEHTSIQMRSAASFGEFIILVVYLPILTLTGIEGKMFVPMAQTVAFALLGAFIFSLTYVPMMSALFLSKKISNKPNLSDKGMAILENAYAKVLNKALKVGPWLVSGSVVLFFLSLGLFSTLGGEFIPELDEGDFAIEAAILSGSNLNESVRVGGQIGKILKDNFQEVEKVVCKIGSGEVPTDPMPIEALDVMIVLKPKAEWINATSSNELMEKMQAKLADIPGLTTGFTYPVQLRFNELMSGSKQDVSCKIYGENLDTLAHYANELGKLVGKVEGAKDLYIETVTGLPQIVARFDRVALARHGLDISMLNQVLRAAFAGEKAGLVYEGERRYDLVVRLAANNRDDLQDVQNLLIPTPSGGQIPLSQVAEVLIEEGPKQIQRDNAKRRILVGFNIRDRDVESVVNDVAALAEKELNLPTGYHIHFGGQFENLQAAQQRLMIAVPVALLLIFVMLYFAFGSIKQGLLVYSAIPLSAIGGIWALWLRDLPFSISAGVGFIALFGVAVLNGIVLLAECNRLLAKGMEITDVVKNATRERLRPVLMTAAVASLGFFPMAFSHGAGAEVQRPLATVVIGGLLTATFLTLFVLPILYRWLHSKVKNEQ